MISTNLPYDDEYIEYEQAAPQINSGGLFLFLLPPLTVILLSFFAFGHVTASEPDSSAKSTYSPTPTTNLSQTEKTMVSENAKQIPVSEPSGELASLFTPEVLHWEGKILTWSEEHGLDPNLVATVMQIESCGDPKATSGSGAMGLFQVMPYHFSAGENAYQPGTNALRGLNYLRQALNKGGSIRMAFAGYNGGISGASQGEAYWHAETQRYVYWGTGIYAAAQAGETTSVRLNEWLAAGGASLCAQAARNLGLNN